MSTIIESYWVFPLPLKTSMLYLFIPPLLPTPGDHWSVYHFHSFAFCRMSYNWNHLLCSIFRFIVSAYSVLMWSLSIFQGIKNILCVYILLCIMHLRSYIRMYLEVIMLLHYKKWCKFQRMKSIHEFKVRARFHLQLHQMWHYLSWCDVSHFTFLSLK